MSRKRVKLTEEQLQCFVSQGKFEDLQSFVNQGVDLDLKSYDGTLLIVAAQRSDWNMVELLINEGADLTYIEDVYEWAFLHYAARSAWIPVVQLFLKKNLDLNIKTAKRETALMIAAQWKNKNFVEVLVNGGADIHCCDEKNWTALHHASCYGSLEVAQYLVRNRININARDVKGHTALHIALKRDVDVEFICFLLRAGADCNIQDNKGRTAFNRLTEKDYLGATRLSIEKGAYVQPLEYFRLVSLPLLKSIVLQRVKYCSQAIANNYNNKDLPALYRILGSSNLLPRIDYLKIMRGGGMAIEIDRVVNQDIQKRGHCNLLEVRPLVLSMMCVDSLLAHARTIDISRRAANQTNPSCGSKRLALQEGPSKKMCLKK